MQQRARATPNDAFGCRLARLHTVGSTGRPIRWDGRGMGGACLNCVRFGVAGADGVLGRGALLERCAMLHTRNLQMGNVLSLQYLAPV